jgi:hypothetical protein
MKRLVISCILILALTNQAYAMGWLGGGNAGGGRSSASVSNSGSGSTASTSNSGTSITPPNSPTGGSSGETGGQGSTAESTITIVGGSESGGPPNNTVPEVTTMFLLCSGLFGLWALRRKFRK